MNFFHHPDREHARTKMPRHRWWRLVAREPAVDWAIIFSLSVAATIVLVVLGFVSYSDLESRLSKEAAHVAPAKIVTIDTDSLNKVIQEFDSRADLRADLLKAYTGPGDPSI